MQNDSIDNLRLDMNKKSVRGVIYVRAGDTRARTVHITLTSNGTVLDLSDAHICEILIRKPDGGMNDQAVDMNEQAMVRYGNELQYTFRTTDINVPGECKCQVMITFNDGAVITSPEFSVMVYQKTIDQNLEKSTNEYTAITQQLTEATELRNQTAQDADRAETARKGVENYEEICRQYSESASDSASNAALSEDAASQSADSASADKELTKEYRDDAETFMEETRTNLAAVEEKTTEILNYDSSAKESAESAAASATSASGSATSAAASAASVEDIKEDSEAYAAGTRNGSPVTSTDPAYHNNSKYYAEQAESSLSNTVRSFNGRNGAVTPTYGDYNIEQISPLNGAAVGQVPVVQNVGTAQEPVYKFGMQFVSGGGIGTCNSIEPFSLAFLVTVNAGFNVAIGSYLSVIFANNFYYSGGNPLRLSVNNQLYEVRINGESPVSGKTYIKTGDAGIFVYDGTYFQLIGTSGGGHSIIDSEGNTMPQETAMQFADSFVSDDETNGRTVVENIKEVDPADYDSTTDEGIIVCDDGNDVPIGEIEEDVVSVTADGVKTYATLLNELYALIDSDKLNENSKLTILESNFNNVFKLSQIRYSPKRYRFESIASVDSIIYIELLSSGSSNKNLVSQNTSPYNVFGDNSSNVPSNGTVITLHYGTSSGIVELNTDARHCMMSDGQSVESAIAPSGYSTDGLTFTNCTFVNGGYFKIGKMVVLNIQVEVTVASSVTKAYIDLPNKIKPLTSLIGLTAQQATDDLPPIFSVIAIGKIFMKGTTANKAYVISGTWLA